MKRYLLLFTCLFFTLTLLAQWNGNKTITGTVVDAETNEPLVGASVLQKDTYLGIVTDWEGKFTLRVDTTMRREVILEVTYGPYAGYETQEIKVGRETIFHIKLEKDPDYKDEVIIMAYEEAAPRVSNMNPYVSLARASVPPRLDKPRAATTWKRSGLPDNSIRLQVGEDDYIPLEAAQLAVQIDGFRVRVLMDCFFYNDKGSRLEGTFNLKLPTEATPYYFAFGETEYLNEKHKKLKEVPYNPYTISDFDLTGKGIATRGGRDWKGIKEARIVPKQKAARAYEKTVRQKVDPALVEWGGADVFSCRVFPLSNHTLHRIVVGYDLNMTEAMHFREYIMSLPQVENDLKVDVLMYHSPELQATVWPELPATATQDNRVLYSMRNPTEKEVAFRYNDVAPIMLVQPSGHNEELDIPYFAANYRVNLPETVAENLPQDAIFILDASVSSNPDKFNVWLSLISQMLQHNTGVIKRFAVLTFNIETRWYTQGYLPNTHHNVSAFMKYAHKLALEGATDLAAALSEAAHPLWEEADAPPKHLFLMSDADCNWGETNMHKLSALIKEGDRVHTYKTGMPGTNVAILNYLSKASGGFSFTVTGEEEAVVAAQSLKYKPWHIERIEVEGCEDFLISGQPTQLYNGQKLIFTGRNIPTGDIRIEVNNGMEQRKIVYAVARQIHSPLTSRVYGQIASAHLENYGRNTEEAAINYSTYYSVPGQYTSLLMLESKYDYSFYGIDELDAESFVEENPVNRIAKEMEETQAALALGHNKTAFLNWLEQLAESEIKLRCEDRFKHYVRHLPEETFRIAQAPQRYKVYKAAQQTQKEWTLLADEYVRFDALNPLAQKRGGKPDALKLLSSAVERHAVDIQIARNVAMEAINWGMADHAYYMMRRIIEWREGEALAYITAAEALSKSDHAEMALVYYYICLSASWDSDYGSFAAIAAVKCLKYLNELTRSAAYNPTPDTRLFMVYMKEIAELTLADEGINNMDEADIVVIVSWDADNTDVDLHVVEPTGERCYFAHRNTKIGGRLTKDVTEGYGPEMYVLKNAIKGTYSVEMDYYGDYGGRTANSAKVYVEVYRDWGRENEKVTQKTVVLHSSYEGDDPLPIMKFRVRK